MMMIMMTIIIIIIIMKMLNGVEAIWTLRSTFAQHPFNFCWTNGDQMLEPFIRALRFWFKPDKTILTLEHLRTSNCSIIK